MPGRRVILSRARPCEFVCLRLPPSRTVAPDTGCSRPLSLARTLTLRVTGLPAATRRGLTKTFSL
ncbi:MAG: hypothetical protein QOF23_1279, partial [Solirubrobacterales bacterium]|nr:hypothetical protein [Solirubrobacterales bacterium]